MNTTRKKTKIYIFVALALVIFAVGVLSVVSWMRKPGYVFGFLPLWYSKNVFAEGINESWTAWQSSQRSANDPLAKLVNRKIYQNLSRWSVLGWTDKRWQCLQRGTERFGTTLLHYRQCPP